MSYMSNAASFARDAARKFKETCGRFPLAVICVVIFYVLGNFDLPLRYGWRWEAFLLSYCGAFWFVSIRLFSESHGVSTRISDAIGFGIFLPISGLALASEIISVNAVGYAFALLFVLMFIAPFMRRRVKRKEIAQFYGEFWGHIGRSIPIVFVLYMAALAIFFWLYPVFDIPLHRQKFTPLSEIIIDVLFPMLALMGIPKVLRAEKGGDSDVSLMLSANGR